MTARLIGQFKPGSFNWLEARRRRIGGSEAAVCLDLSPYDSRFSLWHVKAGYADPLPQDAVMEWGNRLETAVLGRWLDDHPDYQLTHANSTFVADEHPFMIANPDGIVRIPHRRRELIEVKTSPNGDGWGKTGSDDYPVWYRCQVLHYMYVLGIRRAHLIVLVSGYDYRTFKIDWDDQAERDMELIIAAEQAFINSLPGGLAERRPDIDEHAETYRVMRTLHPNIDGGSIEIDPEVAELYLSARRAEKEAQADKTKAASRILDQMGNAQYALYQGVKIADRRSKGVDGIPYLQAASLPKPRNAIAA